MKIDNSNPGANRHKLQASIPETGDTDGDPASRVWQVVAMIPPGNVASYGQIAALIGLPGYARFVGRVLRHLPDNSTLPWHRVVNASLKISPRGGGEERQKARLLAEGVDFIGDRIASGHRWSP